MTTLVQMRKMLRRALSALHLFALVVGLLASPISDALQIKLGETMRVRERDTEGLTVVGTLTKGSVVEIPDRFIKRNKKGKVDAEATFNNWLLQAKYTRTQVNAKVTDSRKDFYYPVRVVSLAKGSTAPESLIGKTRFMALRVLARSQGGLVVKETAKIYVGPRPAIPLRPVSAARAATERPQPRAVPKPAPPRPNRPRATLRSAISSEQPALPEPTPQEPTAPADTSTPTDDQSDDASRVKPTPDASADPASSSESDTPSICETCEAARNARSTDDRATTLATDVQDTVLPAAFDREAQGLQGLTSKFAPDCSNFIRPDGTYGPWGKIAIKELSRFPNTFLNARGMSAVCPNFNSPSFDDAEKRHFWVWALAAIASQESTCQTHVDSKDIWIKRHGKLVRFNPNGIASGLFQIEKDPELRAQRDERYGGTFCSGYVYSPSVNTRCAVRMLEDIVDNNEGPYTMTNHYWSALIDPGTKAKQMIRQYSACGAKLAAVAGKKTHRKSKHKTARRKK